MQSDDRKVFKYYTQYPVMQGSQEGKCANSWGLRAHFEPKIPMEKGPEYQCLPELGQNYNFYKNSTRIQMFRKTRSEFQCLKK